MGKKIIRIVSILNLFVSIFIYICLSIEFKIDPYVLNIISDFDTNSKLYNLALYAMPCVNAIVGLLGLVFVDAKKLMLSLGIFSVLMFLPHPLYLKGVLQVARSIASGIMAISFFVGSVLNLFDK